MRDRIRLRAALLALIVLGGVAGGCGQTHSIQALPPEPVVPVDTTAEALRRAGLARLEVRLRIAGSPLPDEVSAIRLRPTEVRFHATDAAWVSVPSSGGLFTIDRTAQDTRTIVSTQVAPAVYDSVEVRFGDVYVEFGPNAGGPITSADPPAAVRATLIDATVGAQRAIELVLDPGASIMQDAACRWHFLPFVRSTQ
ncbi:MAG TPA: hypothetical protein VF190_03335 [Rhodothermales bacterium]